MSGESGCYCEEAVGWRLVKCLAPPPGEYEVHLKTSSGAILVVNDNGFFLRRFSVEEPLPFIVSRDRPASIEELSGLASLEEVLCMAVRALREASAHGSLRAHRKIRSCSRLIEKIEEDCARREAAVNAG